MAPPSPNRGYGEGAGVMISPDIHERGVAPDIVDAVGIRAGHIGVGKVMPAHLFRLLGRKPLLAVIVVVADELVSRPAGFHRQPLAERCVRLSPHTAPIRRTHRSCRYASVRTGRGGPLPASQGSGQPQPGTPESA